MQCLVSRYHHGHHLLLSLQKGANESTSKLRAFFSFLEIFLINFSCIFVDPEHRFLVGKVEEISTRKRRDITSLPGVQRKNRSVFWRALGISTREAKNRWASDVKNDGIAYLNADIQFHRWAARQRDVRLHIQGSGCWYPPSRAWNNSDRRERKSSLHPGPSTNADGVENHEPPWCTHQCRESPRSFYQRFSTW